MNHEIPEYMRHHIWCNYFMKPRAGCKQCDGLFKQYPYDSEEETADLMKKHFPDNAVRGNP